MSEKNNIDNLFKEGLADKQFAFNPDAWSNMEKMIVDQEKKRGIWWVWPAGIAAAIVLVGGLYIVNTEKPASHIANQQQVNENKKSIEIKINESIKTEYNKPKVVEQNAANNSELKNDNGDIDNQIVDKEPPIKSSRTNESVSLDNKAIIAVDTNVAPVLIDEEYIAIEQPKAVAYGWNDMSVKDKIKLKKQLRKQEMLALMEYKVAVLKVETADNVDEQREVGSNNMNWVNNFNINIIGGANLSQGFLNTNISRVAPSIDPVVGIGASYILNALVSLDINALYHKRGGLSGQELPEEYVASGTSEVAKSLHYVDVPFYINYRVKNRHAVRFGLQYSQLLGVTSEITTTSTSIEFKKQPYFANYDVAGILGYKYLVNERFNVGIRGNFGLFDVTLGQSAGENTFDMNNQVRFLLEYKLLKY